jgi:hypothetical protein
VDIVLSSSDEDTQSSKPYVPSNQKGLVADDVDDKGTASAETLIPGPVEIDVPEMPKPYVADQATVKTPTGWRGRKRP